MAEILFLKIELFNFMGKSLVSVIIPTYNRSELLIRALESLIAQTYTNWECLIVDDGSTRLDITAISTFIKNKEQFVLIQRPENTKKGPSTCRNIGLIRSKGDYIQFFDDDDVMYPEMLKIKTNAFFEKQIDVVVAPLDFFYVKNNKILKQNKISTNNLIEDYVTGKISWYSSGPLWEKSFLKVYFDEDIQTLDDYDFNLRNIYNSPIVEYLTNPLQIYYKYEIGKTLSSKAQLGDESQIRSGFKAYKKHYLLLEKKNLLSKEIKIWLIKRFTFLLRAALLGKYRISNTIFFFIIKSQGFRYFKNSLRIFISYGSYKLFNRGYRLFESE